MKTARGLFRRLCRPDALERATKATVRGKRHRADVALFLFRLDEELAKLQKQLREGTYRPSPFSVTTIRDPKPRLIARVPIRDRVVHTALVHQIEPVFVPSFAPEDFACRPGFGTHRAVLRLQEHMRRYRFTLHLDVRAYFPSIHPEILRKILSRRIRDERLLAVVDLGLRAGRSLYISPDHRRAAALDANWPPPGRGLAIGSYTSQLFAAHLYLNAFDHWIKRQLKIPGYLRYVDDLFLFSYRRAELHHTRRAVAEWLYKHRQLRLKHPKARILSCHGHLDALGHRVRRQGIEPLPKALRRFRHRLSQFLDPLGRPPKLDLERSIASSVGVLLA